MTPTTIERTSKAIKLGLALSAASFWIGLIAFFSSTDAQTRNGAGAMIGVGALAYVVMKIARWWVNG